MRCYDEAIDDFNQALDLQPEVSWFQYKRFLVLQCQGKLQEASAAILLAIRSEKEGCDTHPTNQNGFNLALYHLAIQDNDTAEASYKSILSTHPRIEEVREALEDVQYYLTLFPQDDNFHRIQGILQDYIESSSAQNFPIKEEPI